MNEIIGRLTDYMNRMDFTERSMALKCGIDPSNFSKMMKGVLPITKKTTNKILAATHLNEGWLLTGEGEMLIGGIIQSNQYGDNFNGNQKIEKGCDITELFAAFERKDREIEAQRKLTEKAQEQADRLLTIIEKMQGINR